METTNLDEVAEAISCRADKIMLDNMTPHMVREAVKLIAGRSFVEVSGGITLANIGNYLIEGVNAISVGALTHSPPGIDISVEVETDI